MLKVVLDTNVLIDGSADDFNYGRRIIDEVIAGSILAYANPATLAENRLLADKKISDRGYLKRLSYFFEAVNQVPHQDVNVEIEDEQDKKLLASALAAQVDFLITADRHLLNLEQYQGTKIIRPKEFWNRYEDGTDRGWINWLKDFINA